jgi:hypothetical protein
MKKIVLMKELALMTKAVAERQARRPGRASG